MTNFEHVGAQIGAAVEQTLLRLKPRVAHEQHAELPICEHDDDRVLVDVVRTVGEQRAAG